jgi:hypothetical protein
MLVRRLGEFRSDERTPRAPEENDTNDPKLTSLRQSYRGNDAWKRTKAVLKNAR